MHYLVLFGLVLGNLGGATVFLVGWEDVPGTPKKIEKVSLRDGRVSLIRCSFTDESLLSSGSCDGEAAEEVSEEAFRLSLSRVVRHPAPFHGKEALQKISVKIEEAYRSGMGESTLSSLRRTQLELVQFEEKIANYFDQDTTILFRRNSPDYMAFRNGFFTVSLLADGSVYRLTNKTFLATTRFSDGKVAETLMGSCSAGTGWEGASPILGTLDSRQLIADLDATNGFWISAIPLTGDLAENSATHVTYVDREGVYQMEALKSHRHRGDLSALPHLCRLR